MPEETFVRGVRTVRRYRAALAAVIAATWVVARPCGAEVTGYWVGTVSTAAEETSLGLLIEPSAEGGLSGELDLPDVGVAGWPAREVRREGDSAFRVVIPSDSGPQILSLRQGERGLSGTWEIPGLDAPARVSLGPGERASAAYTEEAVGFENGEVSLSGRVLLPHGEGPFAGVVFLHGSGDTPGAANRFAAEQLAKRGIACLIFDKRGVGSSTGSWRDVGFEELASDGVAAAAVLAAHPRVDARRVGFSGQSQGGWIGPLAASLRPGTAFVISISGPATTPAEEGHWSVIWALRHAARSEQEIAEADRILALLDDGFRDGDFAAFEEALEAARAEPWFEASGLAAFAEVPADWVRAWYARVLDFDPVPILRHLEAPMLSILGSEDESIPAAKSREILERLADEGRDISVRFYEGYDHTMRRTSGNVAPLLWPEQPEDLYDVQADFIQSAKPR